MLARCGPVSLRCLFADRTGFGTWAYFYLPYTVLYGNSAIKNKGRPTFLWNLVPNYGLNFVTARRSPRNALSTSFNRGIDGS